MKSSLTLLFTLLALGYHFEVNGERFFDPKPSCRLWKIKGKVYQNCFYGTAKTRTSTSTRTSSSTSTSTSTRTSSSTSTRTSTSTSTTTNLNAITSAITNYWSFNGNLQDSMTLQSLTPSSTATYVADRKGNANSALYINLQSFALPAAVYFNGALSVTAWINMVALGSFNRPRFLDCGTSTFGQYNILLTIQSSGYLAGFWVDTPTLSSSMEANTNLATNTWYFYAGTSSGSVGYFYINGVQYATATTASAPAVTRDKCWFGLGQLGSGQDPLIQVYADEIRFFNRALTAAEVTTVMNMSP